MITVVLMLMALWLRFVMAPVDAGLQYITFFPTVTIAAIVAGYNAGLLATFIGMIFATYFFTPPYYSFTDEALKFASWGNLVFVLNGIILSLAFKLMHRFRENYQLKLIDAEDSEKQVTLLNQQLSEHIIKLEANQQVLRKYESIIESTNDAIICKNLDGIIQSWNHGAEVLFGYTTAEVIGKPMTILFPEDRLDEESKILSRISQGEKVDHFETVRQRKDGSLIHISATISPIFDLQGKVVGVSKIARNITDRKQLEDKIQQLAFHDSLTSLPNRRLLYDRLNQVQAASKRSGRYGALLFLDLDNFKSLNDSQGHDAGDLLLIDLAERLKSSVRETDTVARLGGDEFVVLLHELDTDKIDATAEMRVVGEKIRMSLSEPYLLRIKKEEGGEDRTVEHRCTVSMGAVLFRNHEESAGEILKRADTAMYEAKHGGRNSLYCVNSSGLLNASEKSINQAS